MKPSTQYVAPFWAECNILLNVNRDKSVHRGQQMQENIECNLRLKLAQSVLNENTIIRLEHLHNHMAHQDIW